MKREVDFFKDNRARSGNAFLEALRALGMSYAEIKSALLEARREIANYEGVRQLDAAQHGVQPDVAVSQQSGVNADDQGSVESPRG